MDQIILRSLSIPKVLADALNAEKGSRISINWGKTAWIEIQIPMASAEIEWIEHRKEKPIDLSRDDMDWINVYWEEMNSKAMYWTLTRYKQTKISAKIKQGKEDKVPKVSVEIECVQCDWKEGSLCKK